jgi:methylaspartate ammonia-lyase
MLALMLMTLSTSGRARGVERTGLFGGTGGRDVLARFVGRTEDASDFREDRLVLALIGSDSRDYQDTLGIAVTR